MSILGNRVVRKEDPKLLTGQGVYVDDIELEGTASLTFVRSSLAHARILGVDTAEARRAPGVIGVYTAADLSLPDLAPELPTLNAAMGRPLLARDRARFVGDLLAAVVTEQRTQGADAAELVVVDAEPLPPVVGVEAALRDETLLFPEAGTNVCLAFPGERDEALFAGCEVVLRHRFVNQRVAPAPLEVRAAASVWGTDGRLTHYASHQNPHVLRDLLAGFLGVEPGRVRVLCQDVGGGFGAKIGLSREEALVAWLARELGRPVRWVESRSESMLALGHGRAQLQDVELGGSRDGRVQAYRLSVLQDAGAYPSVGAFLPLMTRSVASGVYEIPKVEFSSKSVVTTTSPVVAYRGAGRPEATAALERMMDLYAREIGLDPLEVRRRNLIPRDAFPYTNPTGSVYDIGDYEGAMDRLREAAGYAALRAEQERRRASGERELLGIGTSVYVEITNPMPGGEYASVEIRPEGTARVLTGTSPHGQGHVTAWSMIAADALGLPLEAIEVVHGDTDAVPRGQGTGGSRSLQVGGAAVQGAALEVVKKARELAAERLEVSPDDVVLDKAGGRFHVAGVPGLGLAWPELAAAAGPAGLAAETQFRDRGPTFPFGAHLAVVSIDRETFGVRLERLVAVDDAGRILNPLLAEGQLHGGLAQGVAQALLEEVRYDEDGNPLTVNFADYLIVSAAELPDFELVAMETPTPWNPLGAKGIGESGSIGSTPAVQNAVVDALAHLGVRHLDMPCSPERIWRAVQGAGAGRG